MYQIKSILNFNWGFNLMVFQVEKLEKYTFFTPQRLEQYQNRKKKAWIQNFELLDTLYHNDAYWPISYSRHIIVPTRFFLAKTTINLKIINKYNK